MKQISEFLKLRPNLIQRDKVDSSILYARDFAAIMGVDPYVSAYDIWLKRKYGLVKGNIESTYITAGLNLEEVIAKDYYMRNRKDKYSIVKGYEVFKKTETFTIGGIPDFILISQSDSHLEGLEIKTAQADWNELPLDYQIQCQIYMYIMGLTKWTLAVLIRGHEYREYELEYDHEFVNTLLIKANEFYLKYLLGNEEPYDPLEFQKTETINLNDQIDALAEERDKLKLEEKSLNEKISQCEYKIKELIGINKGVIGEKWKATYTNQSRTSYDIDRLCLENNIDKSIYSKVSDFRVLRITSKKQG